MADDATITIGPNQYGKAGIGLLSVTRGADRHHVSEFDVAVSLTGEFAEVHTGGINTNLLPTDSQKNTVYAFARRYGIDPIETFAQRLARHFVDSQPAIHTATVQITQQRWDPISTGSEPHRHSFQQVNGEQRTTRVRYAPPYQSVVSGIAGLRLLKTTGSEFRGYLKDEYTTLPEAGDRLLVTSVTARWRYADQPVIDWDGCHASARDLLVTAFAETDSRSLQHTLYAMGSRLLTGRPELVEVRLALPNQHHLEVDLAPFGLENSGHIYQPLARPYGLIEGTVRRDVALPDDDHGW